MIPLRDANPSSTIPFVNYLLIATNCLVFFFMLSTRGFANDLILRFGLTPSTWLQEIRVAHWHAFIPLFASMFMHGGWLHLLGNMLYLFIFGDNVEDKFGHGRYLVFYLLAGMAAAFTQIYFNPTSDVPMVGASGAIAGVLGAYVFMFPKAKVTTLIFIVIFVKIVDLPAFLFLGIWFITQMFSGVMSLGIGADAGGVAWWAHIGGFAAGAIGIPIFRKR